MNSFDQIIFWLLYSIRRQSKRNPTLQGKTPLIWAWNKLKNKEIKLKYLSEKENEYGTNHFFEVLDITPVKN